MRLPETSTLIAVALSGGVDSAVAAALLQQQGHRLVGITMNLLPDAAANNAAEQVAEHLQIPLHRIDLTDAFEQQVIAPFVTSYRNGETPNPCVRCNRLVKFGLLLDHAHQLGAGALATGHYARVLRDADGRAHLHAAADRRKDQSYFLATIGQEALQQTLFPLGGMSGKDQVRQLAHEFGLPVAAAKDSQDVCFLPDSGYTEFLEKRSSVSAAQGLIVHRSGRLLGRHNGFWRYTVGQRKGLGIAWAEPLYVLEISAVRNRVVVGEQQYLYASGLLADQAVWFGQEPGMPFEAHCKIRYRHAPVPCLVEPQDGAGMRVLFHEPQRAVTPGQTVVIYQGDEVLGAGRITGAELPC
ncbi:MAG: tRNA 2-thiouridine(34) synthase MnmA [Trichlorobacter sp.]|uniref:tRNA 2-thiouridine(34) synthase MnmA n=1 Tax=Trichlorobacter sp. TaxID=2911007 RepID=UPI002561A4D6|nr:tRNA 2-thiouridine(34) synthase MnmA [Trichlorobacter sp.]MDK9716430.1 tRNA 2-thiouridine(34) synthase MnmA [Trichlorobacter sp.]